MSSIPLEGKSFNKASNAWEALMSCVAISFIWFPSSPLKLRHTRPVNGRGLALMLGAYSAFVPRATGGASRWITPIDVKKWAAMLSSINWACERRSISIAISEHDLKSSLWWNTAAGFRSWCWLWWLKVTSFQPAFFPRPHLRSRYYYSIPLFFSLPTNFLSKRLNQVWKRCPPPRWRPWNRLANPATSTPVSPRYGLHSCHRP